MNNISYSAKHGIQVALFYQSKVAYQYINKTSGPADMPVSKIAFNTQLIKRKSY